MIQYAYTLLWIFYVPRLEHYIADESIDVCVYRRSGDGFILIQDEETAALTDMISTVSYKSHKL